jgi:hypothetical protein
MGATEGSVPSVVHQRACGERSMQKQYIARPPRVHAGAGPATMPLLRPAAAERRQAERVTPQD